MTITFNIFKCFKKYLIVLFILFFTATIFSQEDNQGFENRKDKENFGRFRYVDIIVHSGFHFYSEGDLIEYVDEGYNSVDIRFGWQPNEKDHWSSSYGYPSYGIGAYIGKLGDPQVFGIPFAVFGFVNFPLSKPGKRNTFQISPALGFVSNLSPYDEVKNPLNDAIGYGMAFYLNFKIGAELKLNRELDFLYGVDYTHFSNGRLYTPNSGLDMYGLNLGIRYLYNADQKIYNDDIFAEDLLQARFKRYSKTPKTKINKSFINIFAGISSAQNAEDAGTSQRYFTFSGVLDYQYVFNNIHGVTMGLDLILTVK